MTLNYEGIRIRFISENNEICVIRSKNNWKLIY